MTSAPRAAGPFRLGLTGFPLDHSLSPRIHAAALDACGLDGDYALFPLPPDDARGLPDLLRRVRSGELHGLNVTVPHKQNVIPLLDDLTPTARAIGAVNTICLRGGKLTGENTDAPGFLADLRQFPAGQFPAGSRRSALVLGAGGAARAVVHALLAEGWDVTVAARRSGQARQLASAFADRKLWVAGFPAADFRFSDFTLLVNATPVGMFPRVERSPLPENLSLPSTLLVYDLVYNPRETAFVRAARAQGLFAATGLGMLIEQAALAFEIWTGCNPPRDILRRAVEDQARNDGD